MPIHLQVQRNPKFIIPRFVCRVSKGSTAPAVMLPACNLLPQITPEPGEYLCPDKQLESTHAWLHAHLPSPQDEGMAMEMPPHCPYGQAGTLGDGQCCHRKVGTPQPHAPPSIPFPQVEAIWRAATLETRCTFPALQEGLVLVWGWC